MSIQIHKTAIVDAGAKIGQGTKVWHWSHVSAGAKIGNDVVLGQNVFVGNNCEIGNNCKIQNNVSIFDNVFLEEAVFCGPSVVFTNVYNPRALINRKDQYRDTLIKKGATIGANSTILCGLEIGEFAFIGASSLVLKNVPSYALMVGSPARQIAWIGEYGEKLDLPLTGKMETICKKTNQKYILNGSILTKC